MSGRTRGTKAASAACPARADRPGRTTVATASAGLAGHRAGTTGPRITTVTALGCSRTNRAACRAGTGGADQPARASGTADATNTAVAAVAAESRGIARPTAGTGAACPAVARIAGRTAGAADPTHTRCAVLAAREGAATHIAALPAVSAGAADPAVTTGPGVTTVGTRLATAR